MTSNERLAESWALDRDRSRVLRALPEHGYAIFQELERDTELYDSAVKRALVYLVSQGTVILGKARGGDLIPVFYHCYASDLDDTVPAGKDEVDSYLRSHTSKAWHASTGLGPTGTELTERRMSWVGWREVE